MACLTCSVRSRSRKRPISQKQTDRITELTEQINHLQNELETAHGIYDSELEHLEDTKTKVKKKIAHLKANLIKLLDDYEKVTLATMDQTITQFKADFQHEFKQSRDDLKATGEILENIKTSKKVDEITLSDTQKLVTKTQEFIDKIKYGHINIEFKPEEKLLNLETEIKSLGDFAVNLKRDSTKPYIIKNVQEITPGTSNELASCCVSGICCLSNGDLVITDSCNKKLTRLSKDSFTHSGSLRFLSNPWSVCKTKSDEVAVTFPEETRNVRFISVANGRLQRTRSLRLRHICRGIGYSGEELFVTDQGIFVYVYTIEGTLLTKFSRDTFSDHRLLSDYRSLSVSNHLIVLTDWEEGVTAFDRQGKLVWRHNDDKTKRASGVCFDGDENVFICCSQTINIVQIDKHGHVVGEIASSKNGLEHPTSICFDTKRSVMIVGQHEAKSVTFKVV